MNQEEKLHSIQQVSTKLNIPKPTLRFWEKEFEGLLLPLRTSGGQRRYTSEHISIVEEINELKKVGLGLAEIRSMLRRARMPEIGIHRSGDGQAAGIDHLAERVAAIVKMEIHRFFVNKVDGNQS